MKKLLVIVFVLFSCLAEAQETVAKKPAYVMVINDSIVSMDKVNEYAKAGAIKSMQKGVSDDQLRQLRQKLGDKVGEDKSFVMVITLLSEEEKKARANRQTTAVPAGPTDEGYKLKVNDQAADFTAEMLDGQQIKLSELKGKVVLLNFWATWCGPCMAEFEEIPSQIVAPFKNKDFVLLPVSRGETREKVAAKMEELKKKGIDFNVALDPEKAIWNKYANIYIPKNFLIDKKGVIRFVSTGAGEDKMKQLVSEIQKLLKE
jgi:peroxiredoxin